MKKNSIVRQLTANITLVFGKKATSPPSHVRKVTVDDETKRIMREWISNGGWAQNLNYDEVASTLGISKQKIALYTYCMHHTTFLRWRRELRIEAAKRILLEDKRIPTSLVGEFVGIPDSSNFRRLFREMTGYNPGEWRRLKH